MAEKREEAGQSWDGADPDRPTVTSLTPDHERVILLECRMEQLRSQLQGARAEADHARTRLAEATAREADHARRASVVHQELADARAEVAALHQRLERSEALRSEMEGHLFESGAQGDTQELGRLRREIFQERHRAIVNERALARLRGRVEELLSSRETLLTRVAEWQQLVREDGPEAADLSSYLSELRREILDLEHRSSAGEGREAALRERLALAGFDPDDEETRSERAALPERSPTPDPEIEEPGPEGSAAAEPVLEVPQAEPPIIDRSEPVASIPADAVAAESLPEGSAIEEPVAEDQVVEKPVEAGESTVRTAVPEPDPAEGAEPEERAAGNPVLGAARTEPEGPEQPDMPVTTPEPATHQPAARPAEARSASLVEALASADLPALRSELLRRIGHSGQGDLGDEVRPWTESSDPPVRAAAYEALGRLLERDPAALEPDIRSGLADPDARVRRRVVLAAATARGLPLWSLLDPLREDPDPQVRRVVREVLRHVPPAETGADPGPGRQRLSLTLSGPVP